MPVSHCVLIKFKKEVTKEDVDKLYNGLMSLEKLPMIQSVTAGENYAEQSSWDFSYVMVITNLRSYKESKAHSAVVDAYLTPIAEEVTSSDFEFPRSTAEHLKVGVGGEESPMTPNRMRFSPSLSNEQLSIMHGTVAKASADYAATRFAVGSAPVSGKLYFDVTIELNPTPSQRDVSVGLVRQSDLTAAKENGAHFKTLEGAFGYECSGGFVGGGHKGEKEITIPSKEWPYDAKVGVWVDQERGIIQFFLNRKKIGPTIHEDLGDHNYPAVCLGKGVEVSIDFNASCPHVYLG